LRHYAKKLVRDVGTNPKKLFEHLVAHDSAMAAQVAGILYNLPPVLKPNSLDSLLKKTSLHIQQGFKDFNNALPKGP